MDKWFNVGLIDGWTDRLMDKWIDGWIGGLMLDGLMDWQIMYFSFIS